MTKLTSLTPILALGLFSAALTSPCVAQIRSPARLKAEFTADGVKLSPQKAMALVAAKGQPRTGSVEIINQESEPLRILSVEHPTDRLTSRLETVEEGRRYRLSLTLRPDGPVGRGKQTLRITTSSKTSPVLEIPVGTRLTEKVYTSVAAVDLGSLRLGDLRNDTEIQVEEFAIFQTGGTDFRVTHSTDLPMLRVTSERDSRGGYYVIHLLLVREKLRPGQIKGSIILETNDPEFRKLEVPVTGSISP